MKAVLVIVLVCIAVVGIFLFVRSRIVYDTPLRVNEIPAVVAQLKASGRDASFVVFLFSAPDHQTDDDGKRVNLQFSIDHGQLGLDWVLLSDQNITDEVKIREFMRLRGFAVNKLTQNGVTFLRVEDGDIVGLAMQITTEFYLLKPDERIDMIIDGFDWKPGN